MPQQRTIVFRQWCRKGYAIFAGLGHHIVIGVLSVSVCAMALLKSGVLVAPSSETLFIQVSQENDDESSLPDEMSLVLASTSALSSSDAAASDCNILNYRRRIPHYRFASFHLYNINLNYNDNTRTY